MKTLCQTCDSVGEGVSGHCAVCGGVSLYVDSYVPALNVPATPLLISTTPGLEGVQLKLENANLSGSFKDRVMRVLVQEAVQSGAPGAVVASSGNAAVAAASACARADLPVLVLVPETVAPAAVSMVELRGGVVVRAGEGPAAVHGLASRLATEFGLVNLASTFGAAGCEWACRGIGHELAVQVPGEVTHVAAAISVGPVLVGTGNGLHEAGRPFPTLVAAQAAACAPIARAFAAGHPQVQPWTGPATTGAVAIADRLTTYADEATFALQRIVASGGVVDTATDAEMSDARAALARHDGIDVELASAAAAVVLRRRWEPSPSTVCVLTGSGMKETIQGTTKPARPVPLQEFARRTGTGRPLEEVIGAWIRESQ